MRKRLEGNGMKESSLIMVPEHKDRINHVYNEKDKMLKPELTEEEQQELYDRIRVSKSETLPVTVTIVRKSENRKIYGIVTAIDPRYHLIKVEQGPIWEVFQLEDVIRVDLEDAGY